MMRTIDTMRTGARVTKRSGSYEELLAEIAELQSKYEGLTADNVSYYFDGPDGIVPSDVIVEAMRAEAAFELAALGAPPAK